MVENAIRGTYSLKLVKPSSKVDVDSCPTVSLREENGDDERQFQIMHGFHHKNILRLKLLSKNKMQTNEALPFAAFVEPYDNTLRSICGPDQCVDGISDIPSALFQKCVRYEFQKEFCFNSSCPFLNPFLRRRIIYCGQQQLVPIYLFIN